MVSWQPGMTLAALERLAIQAAMQFYHSNKVKVARSLDISERTLFNKLEQYENERTDRESTKPARELDDRIFEKRKRGIILTDDEQKHFERRESERAAVARSAARGVSPQAAQHGVEAEGRLHVESSSDVSEKREMSVRERAEVQEMSSRKAAHSSSGKRR